MGHSLGDVLVLLDVGHGNCAVLLVGDDAVVIDVGPGGGLLGFLEEQGIGRLKTVVLSHADRDHVGAAAQLLASETVVVERVVVNSDGIKGSATWDDLIYELDQAHKAGAIQFDVGLVADELGKYGEGRVEVSVVAPSRYLAGKGAGNTDRNGRKITSNSISAVIAVRAGGRTVALLPGDLDDVGLENMLSDGGGMEASTLVFPHHGGRPGKDIPGYVSALCATVNPQTVVFSIGRGQYRTPNPEVVEAVRVALPDVRILCTQLSEHCARSVSSEAAAHLNGVFALGRDDRRCCAGTVLVELAEPFSVLPVAAEHAAFVAGCAESSLCQPRKP